MMVSGWSPSETVSDEWGLFEMAQGRSLSPFE
jgi:hypothetical protein